MITETGRVVAVEDKWLWVEVIQQSMCQSCSAQKGCGQSLLNKLHGSKRNHVQIALGDFKKDDFSVGDTVSLGIQESVLLVGSVIVYLIPLSLMIAGMLLAGESFQGDGGAIVGAIIGFVLGAGFVRWHSATHSAKKHYLPKLLGKPNASTDVIICEVT